MFHTLTFLACAVFDFFDQFLVAKPFRGVFFRRFVSFLDQEIGQAEYLVQVHRENGLSQPNVLETRAD